MSLLERVYFFHGEISRNRYPNARSLMREFEVSLATARRDIAYLRDRLLAPLTFDTAKNGFFYTEDGFLLPFDNSPRIAFLLGMLSRLAEETGLSGLPEIRQLEKRLASMITPDYSHLFNSIHCEWIEVEYPDPVIFDTIIEAIIKKKQLSVIYQSPQRAETERVVEPLKLVNYQGRWYVFAWCTLRLAYRLFHLARFRACTIGPKAQQPVRNNTLDLEGSFGIFKGPPRYYATILFVGTAAELVKNQFWHKNQQVEETPEGIVFQIPVNDDREIMMKIMQYGSQAKVLAPSPLADKVKKEAARMAALYQPLKTHFK